MTPIFVYRSISFKEFEVIKNSHFQEFPVRMIHGPINLTTNLDIVKNCKRPCYISRFLMLEEDVLKYELTSNNEFIVKQDELKQFNKDIIGYIEILEKIE